MPRDFGKNAPTKNSVVRFRRSRAIAAIDVAGQEEISVSGLMAVSAAQRDQQG